MNAYELADELGKREQTLMYVSYIADAQSMLRQQADRIAELEKECSEWEKAYNWMEIARNAPEKVSSKPVAWGIANTRPTEKNPLMQVMLYKPLPSHLVIPLYTHPVNTCKHGVDDGACKECYIEVTRPAELTDEEIEEVIGRHWNKEYGNRNMLTLCRAVLRKASEK